MIDRLKALTLDLISPWGRSTLRSGPSWGALPRARHEACTGRAIPSMSWFCRWGCRH